MKSSLNADVILTLEMLRGKKQRVLFSKDSTQPFSFLKPNTITVAVNTQFSGKGFASSVTVSDD